MIMSITYLKAKCEKCRKAATYRVVRTNDELDSTYVRVGTRSIYYCESHLPAEEKLFWSKAVQ